MKLAIGLFLTGQLVMAQGPSTGARPCDPAPAPRPNTPGGPCCRRRALPR